MNEIKRKETIEEILNIELDMFLSVPTGDDCACQEYPESFKRHRRAQFSPWSRATLESYLSDLRSAAGAGTNLMTRKYARMDNLIEPLSKNPLIDVIVTQQCAWQRAMGEKYPGIINRGRPLSSTDDSEFMTSFETYTRSELETYSDRTLELLHGDIQGKFSQGTSMTEEVYLNLVLQMGYESLDDAEQAHLHRGSINTDGK